ncbi:MAG: hypothetical protein U1E14_04590 [Geminicoccaceae bacterium]
MPAYLVHHWRGEHSLGRSMWINGALVAVVLLATMLALAWPTGLTFDHAVWAAVAWTLVALAATVWHAVGQWRSATRLLDRGGSAAASGVGCVGIVPGWLVVWLLAAALFFAGAESRLARKAEVTTVWRDDAGIVHVSGLPRDGSEIWAVLAAGPVRELRVGALYLDNGEVLALAHLIRDRGLTVVADGYCNSDCFTLLLASPQATVTPDVRLWLDSRSVADLWASDADNAERLAFYRSLGLDDALLRQLREQRSWSPGLGELVARGLVDQIRDGIGGESVPAQRWCETKPGDCATDRTPDLVRPMPPLYHPPPQLPGMAAI